MMKANKLRSGAILLLALAFCTSYAVAKGGSCDYKSDSTNVSGVLSWKIENNIVTFEDKTNNHYPAGGARDPIHLVNEDTNYFLADMIEIKQGGHSKSGFQIPAAGIKKDYDILYGKGVEFDKYTSILNYKGSYTTELYTSGDLKDNLKNLTFALSYHEDDTKNLYCKTTAKGCYYNTRTYTITIDGSNSGSASLKWTHGDDADDSEHHQGTDISHLNNCTYY